MKQAYRFLAAAAVVITVVGSGVFHDASIARFERVITRVFDGV